VSPRLSAVWWRTRTHIFGFVVHEVAKGEQALVRLLQEGTLFDFVQRGLHLMYTTPHHTPHHTPHTTHNTRQYAQQIMGG
jgi:hypothetical protein